MKTNKITKQEREQVKKEIEYKTFRDYDRSAQIRKMIFEGYKPANFVEAINYIIKKDLNEYNLGILDAMVANRSGDIKIIRDSEHLISLDWNSDISQSGLVLSDQEFGSLIGENVLYLKKQEIDKIKYDSFSHKNVKDSKILKFLAREDDLVLEFLEKESLSPQRKSLFEKRYKFFSKEKPKIIGFNSAEFLWNGVCKLNPIAIGGFSSYLSSEVLGYNDVCRNPASFLGIKKNIEKGVNGR
jgi:hypothetical protein